MAGRGGGQARALSPDPLLEEEQAPFARLRKRSFFRVLRTSAFRYIIFTAFLFVVSVTILGYVVYESTIGAAYDQIETELTEELDRLERISEQSGASDWGALNAVVLELESNKLTSNLAYMVWLDEGNYAARFYGNLEGLPMPYLGSDGSFEFFWAPEGPSFADEMPRKRRYLGLSRTLSYERAPGQPPVRATILLARDIDALYELRQTRSDLVVRVLGATLFLAVLLGGLLGTALVRRLDAINRSVTAITEGDLTRRLPVTGSGDEFDVLTRNINLMLDRIEQLMTGMRQVSDNIAHDLRSPLTRIRARLDAVLHDEEAAGSPQEVLERTRDEVERLLKTFNALLSITRIEAGTNIMQGTVNVAAVAEEMLELYVPAGEEEGVTITSEIEHGPPIPGSRELVSQAIANLLDNALKYARHPVNAGIRPRILLTVTTRPDGGSLLTVMDNGPGVAERDRERITQRFVRLERSRSTQGSGLGLALVSAIVKRHGGRMVIGRGLSHQEKERSLQRLGAYGLGVRIALPGAKDEAAKKPAASPRRPKPAQD